MGWVQVSNLGCKSIMYSFHVFVLKAELGKKTLKYLDCFFESVRWERRETEFSKQTE